MKKLYFFQLFFFLLLFSSLTTEMKAAKTINLTKMTFLSKIFNYEDAKEWNYLNDKPCLIDFYASWCGPCKMMSPILEELAKEYEGEIYVYKVNIDKEAELAAAFGINSIPVLLFCPLDKAPQIFEGALPKEALKKAIDELLLDKE